MKLHVHVSLLGTNVHMEGIQLIFHTQDGHWYGSCEEGNSIYGRHTMYLSTCAN